jgi:predicted ATPase
VASATATALISCEDLAVKTPGRVEELVSSRLRLTSVALSGFKAVKHAARIPIGDFTLVIGRNGSGKSSFVEAIQWLQESMWVGLQRATEERFRRYEDLRNKRSKFTKLHLEFAGPEQPVQYDLKVQKAAKWDSPIVVNEELRIRPTNAQRKLIWTTKGRKGPAVRSVRGGTGERDGDRLALATAPRRAGATIAHLRSFLRNTVVLRLSPTSMTDSVPLDVRARGSLLDEQGRGLPGLLAQMTARQRSWVRQRVEQVIVGIENVRVVQTERGRGYFAADERMLSRGGSRTYEIPAWMLSEGTRRMTALFALMATDPAPAMLIVEEIENGLDPWTLEFVLSELREATERGTQVVLTTHSPFLLDHVAAEEVVVVRREKGESVYERITDYDDVVKYGGVVAPGAMYLAGYYATNRSGR